MGVISPETLQDIIAKPHHKVSIIYHELNTLFAIREDNLKVLEVDSLAISV